MRDYLGKPLIFAIGDKSITQRDHIPYTLSSGQTEPALNTTLLRAGTEIYGSDDPKTWDSNRGTDSFVSPFTFERLFSAIGYRYYFILPYEYVAFSDATKIENERFVKASDYITEAHKGRHGREGGSGFVKCKIVELGYETTKNYGGVRVIGGDFFRFPDNLSDVPVNYAEDFLVNDWFNSNPIDGGRFGGKNFFFNKGGGFSLSNEDETNVFSNPVKTLNTIRRYSYTYGNSFFSTVRGHAIQGQGARLFINFLTDVDTGRDTYNLNETDGLSYSLRDEDGNNVEVLSFVLTAVDRNQDQPSQVMIFTNKGVFYWGFDRGSRLTGFLRLIHVDRFRGSNVFVPFFLQNRVYLSSFLNKGLFLVSYSDSYRSFSFRECTTTNYGIFNDMQKMVKFDEDRVLFLSGTENKELWVCNLTEKGDLTGFSQFAVNGYNFIDITDGESEAYFLFLDNANSEYVVSSYGGDTDLGRAFDCFVALPPFSVGRYSPFHSLANQSKKLISFILFKEDISDIELGIDGADYRSLNSFSRGEVRNTDIQAYYNRGSLIMGTQGSLSFKIRGGVNKGRLSGGSFYLDASEVSG